jgi:hypothetical protein
MKQIQSHILDLTQIDGNGEFLCPECGNRISPDNYTEKDYSILEIKMETESLNEVIIQCNACARTIHLTGFSLLHELSRTEIKKNSKLKKEEMILAMLFTCNFLQRTTQLKKIDCCSFNLLRDNDDVDDLQLNFAQQCHLSELNPSDVVRLAGKKGREIVFQKV